MDLENLRGRYKKSEACFSLTDIRKAMTTKKTDDNIDRGYRWKVKQHKEKRAAVGNNIKDNRKKKN